MIRNRSNSRLPKFVHAAAALCLAAVVSHSGDSQAQSRLSKSTPAHGRTAYTEAELLRLRAEVIAKSKESRAGAEKLLALHEEEYRKQQQQYEQRRRLYEQGFISRVELQEAERALTASALRVEEGSRRITESDVTITEASLRDELLRLPSLPTGTYSETGSIMRYNGAALWSLANVGEIEKFFARTFGQALPISAFGQTATHDRLRFDHRNAIDVALHPDSNEGRSLLSFLREAGIPFIAFRKAAPGAATGAHIHVGQPSLRN